MSTKIRLKQIGDMEPSCPKCNNANAMLHEARENKSGIWEHVLKCRDCGFWVPEKDVVIVQCHECEWFRKQGVKYTCHLPGSVIGNTIENPFSAACMFSKSKRTEQ